MTGSDKLPVCMCAVRRSIVAKIIITYEGRTLKEIELVKERVTIGRKAYNDIVLEDRAVSGQHATITVMLDDAILEDMGSTNGTFIAGNKIYRQKLADGDVINIANFSLVHAVQKRSFGSFFLSARQAAVRPGPTQLVRTCPKVSLFFPRLPPLPGRAAGMALAPYQP